MDLTVSAKSHKCLRSILALDWHFHVSLCMQWRLHKVFSITLMSARVQLRSLPEDHLLRTWAFFFPCKPWPQIRRGRQRTFTCFLHTPVRVPASSQYLVPWCPLLFLAPAAWTGHVPGWETQLTGHQRERPAWPCLSTGKEEKNGVGGPTARFFSVQEVVSDLLW